MSDIMPSDVREFESILYWINSAGLVALLTAVVKAMWVATTFAQNWIRFHYFARTVVYRSNLGQAKRELDILATFHCSIVRYGTDAYVRDMANEQQKIDGRLQLRILDVQIVTENEGQGIFRLEIPVHKQMGTQFKCFAEARDDKKIKMLVNTLEQCDCIYDVSPSDSIYRRRVYFLLKDYTTVETNEKYNGKPIINNYVFPE